ncbi:MAG: hypothetical protein L3K13_08880, partial [Thermoplasmata archaeon]|nr:hypothetical protein [Thermoplasmata archaeon]
ATPLVSPRKSSTSSGKPVRFRSRYLGLEVAGAPLSPKALEARLRASLPPLPGLPGPRVIRLSSGRALVEVAHVQVGEARTRWNSTLPAPGPELRLVTRRSWGTLRKGKVWLRSMTATGARARP